MKHSLFPQHKTFMWRILKHYLIIIIALSLVVISAQYFFYKISRTSAANLSRMQEMQELNHYVSDMYENVQNYFNNSSADYLNGFSDNYEHAYAIADRLYEQYKSSDVYIYRDIRAVLESYYENGQELLRAIDTYRETTFYLRADLMALERLKNYLHQQAYLGIENMLTESQEYAHSALTVLHTANNLLNIAILLFISLCIIFAYNISKQIATPIHQLSIQFQKVAAGNLQIRASKIKSDDEINLLIDAFNDMVEKLQKSQDALIQKQEMELKLQKEYLNTVKMEALLKESELKFLHMQINPHFLFNTLNSILSLAQIEEAETTSEMITSLSTLLRYTLNTVNEKLPLASEIKIIENYLFIQKTRFGSRLNYELDIDNDCLNRLVPSMILQPLVENAIIHGLETSPNGGSIYISAHCLDNALEIIVRDDGIGMIPDVLNRLNNPYDNSPSNTYRGIGIANVQKRLQLMYNESRMEITSTVGKGTCVHILL